MNEIPGTKKVARRGAHQTRGVAGFVAMNIGNQLLHFNKFPHKAWKAGAQRSIDNAHMRYYIAHLHRLHDEH